MRPVYNLDLIISLGYRVKSAIATQFCIWVTVCLREDVVKRGGQNSYSR
jgi:hypothetical protein